MAEQYLINDTTLTSIADAIRAKYNDETKYLPREMPEAIRGIPNGGIFNQIVARTIESINDVNGQIIGVRSYALSGCSQLRMVSLPGAVTVFANSFDDCVQLESVYLMRSTGMVYMYSNAFPNTPITDSSLLGHYGSIFVPASMLTSYRSSYSYYSSRFAAYDG